MCNVKTILQVIGLCFWVSHTVDGTRVRRDDSTNCPRENFLCQSGECIDGDSECDGIVDCQDASDESTICRRLRCPPFLFTCKYGACINKNLQCDGKPDCRDSSDEDLSECPPDETSPQCGDKQFRCRSGQCIDEDSKCDGTAECNDHSDELKKVCWNVPCPGFTFKCKYGACVNGKAKCNGVVECLDGSDEDPSVCKKIPTETTVTPTVPIVPRAEGSECVLPQHPKFGQWKALLLGSLQESLRPGMLVRNGAVLSISCMKGYKLDGNNVIYCNNGTWTSGIGTCLRTCPDIKSTATMQVTCTFSSGKETINCTDVFDGTIARFKCAPFYEAESLRRHAVHVCLDGTWDYPEPRCEPVCGQKTVDATTLIIRGKNVTKGDYPWQVALYTRHDSTLICGGSLLNQRVVLTAAHCVTDAAGKLEPKENYIVAVGKYYRSFNDSRDFNDAQLSEVAEIFFPEQYAGDIQNYLGDLAILVTRKTFTLSRRVQPVCLDTGETYDLRNSDYGYVTGWGYTREFDTPSEVLKELKVPSVSMITCRQTIPEDFEVYLTYDKLCAGYLDNSTSVCKGDSGGGLVFKHDGRYYVTGIVSVSPNSPTAEGGCDSQQYGYFTNVAKHMKFILQKLAQFKVSPQ